jgi:NAD(P)-dependent dehydrogenase (short-subunit alcohol dehydrogenase family)
MINLNNKIVLITGATGALGNTSANVFAQANANLALTGRSQRKLETLQPAFSSTQCMIKTADLCNEQDTKQLVDNVIEHYGRIDVLLNIAGGFDMGKRVHELSEADFDKMFDMNFTSTLNTCKQVIPHMLKQGAGKIVNVSARAALEGKGKMAPYCISKSAVITLTESLAAEHKSNDINVNCVLPGTIDTPTNRSDMPNADFSTWVPTEDIANTMLFLCSGLANSVNGAIVPVFGKS